MINPQSSNGMTDPQSSSRIRSHMVMPESGYKVCSFFLKRDLRLVREMICDRVSNVLCEEISYDELLSLPKKALDNVIRKKQLRMFSPTEVQKVLGTLSATHFFKKNGGFELVKATDPLLGQIEDFELYFRIVPVEEGGNKELGHIDWWYDEIYGIPKNDRPQYKIWISINTEPGLSGLMVKKVLPDIYSYRTLRTAYSSRPQINDPPGLDFYDFPAISPGQAIVFESENVLHLGSPNNGDLNRISLEIPIRPKLTEGLRKNPKS